MNRVEAVAHLEENFNALRSDAGMQTQDNGLGWKPVIDRAWRMLGVATASLATEAPSDDDKAIAALDVMAYRHFLTLLTARPNISGGMPTQSTNYSDARRGLEALYKTAAAAASQQGLVVPTDDGIITTGRYNLDVLEPYTVDEFA